MREMAQPTDACVEVVREYIRPMADMLRDILSELLPHTTPAQIYMAGFSCSESGGVLTCSGGHIAPGATGAVTIWGIAPRTNGPE